MVSSIRATTWWSTGTSLGAAAAVDDAMGAGVGIGGELVVTLGAAVVVVTLGAKDVVTVAVAVALTVAVGAFVAAEAVISDGPKEVRARVNETTRASEAAGYATTARTRMRRAVSLFKLFTFLTP